VTDHVSHMAHLVAGAIGAVFGFFMTGDKKVKSAPSEHGISM
jgi:hypothetical protein